MTEQNTKKLSINDIDWLNLTSDDIMYGYGANITMYRGSEDGSILPQCADPFGFSRDVLLVFRGEDCFPEMLDKYLKFGQRNEASYHGTVSEYVAAQTVHYATVLEIADYVKKQADRLIPEIKMRIRLNRRARRQMKDPDVRAITDHEIAQDKAKLRVFRKSVPKLYKLDCTLYSQIHETYVPALKELAKQYQGDEMFQEVKSPFIKLELDHIDLENLTV